jgi:hypothetical protein
MTNCIKNLTSQRVSSGSVRSSGCPGRRPATQPEPAQGKDGTSPRQSFHASTLLRPIPAIDVRGGGGRDVASPTSAEGRSVRRAGSPMADRNPCIYLATSPWTGGRVHVDVPCQTVLTIYTRESCWNPASCYRAMRHSIIS